MAINIPKLSKLPKFDAPPIVETVLGVQFSPIPDFKNAYIGWFWKNYLESQWDSIIEVPRITDQFERFEEDQKWGNLSGFTIEEELKCQRHQLLKSDGTRMIQIQDSRFIYNWQKKENVYPSYEVLKPEFKSYFEKFEEFLRDLGADTVEVAQWEVTYVNHIFKCDLWETIADWSKIFPSFISPAIGIMDQRADSFNGEWRLVIGDNYGRLHISLKHVRIGSASGQEAIALQFTARGPIDPKRGIDYKKGFDIGHASIVMSFDAMTSLDAHKFWRKNDATTTK